MIGIDQCWCALVVRFSIVGLSGTAVNVGLLYLLYGVWRWPLVVGVLLATEVAIVNNFIWNDRWTFGKRAASVARLARFNLSSLGSACVAIGTTGLLVAAGLPYLPADLLGVAGGVVINFTVSTRWTWRMSHA